MPDLRVNIWGDSRSLKRALNGAAKDVSGFKSKLGGIGSIAAGVFGGGAALAGLSSLTHQLGSVVEEAREAGKVTRLTNAVIKSTGGVANVTAGQLGRLSEAISNKTGIDDEAIQSSGNLLLTFTKVRNEVGKGNDIFNQATQAAVDMSVALGSDSKSAALQLGKALNDPVKGVTALTRAGVSFTQQQKDQIKALVASGRTLEAQKLILGEIQTQFGGAAAAAADPMQKLEVTINNLKERIGTALLPYIEKAATWLGEKLPGALDKLEKIMSDKVLPVLKQVTAWLKDKLGGAIEGGKKIIEDLAKAFGTSEGTIVKALGAIAIALDVVALAWNAGPGIIVTAVVALGAALLYAYNKVDWFRAGVQFVFKAIATYVRVLIAFWKGAFQRLAPIVKVVVDAVKVYANFLRAYWETVFRAVKVAVGVGVAAFVWFKDRVQFIVDAVKAYGSFLINYWTGVFNAVRAVVGVAVSAFNWLKDTVGTAVGFIKNVTTGIWDGLTRGLSATINMMLDSLERGINLSIRILNTALDGIDKAAGPLVNFGEIPEVNLPRLAKGGIVTKPTVALIGEAGPEAVVPLSRASRPAAIGAGGGTIEVAVHVNVDPITGRKVLRLAQEDQRLNGPWAIRLATA